MIKIRFEGVSLKKDRKFDEFIRNLENIENIQKDLHFNKEKSKLIISIRNNNKNVEEAKRIVKSTVCQFFDVGQIIEN